MAGVGWRYKEYTGDAVNVVPTTKAAGAATIAGTVLKPFEGMGWGGATVTTYVGDTTKITNGIRVNTYVSFDEGTSYLLVDGDTATVTVDGGSSGFRRLFIPFAPRVRIDYVYDASAALSAAHGLTSTVTFQESDPEAARTLFENVLTMGDTSLATAPSTFNGDTVEINHPNKLTIWYTSSDVSKIGDTWETVILQGSEDAANWWNMTTLTQILPVSSSASYPFATSQWEVEEGDSSLNTLQPSIGPFPKYARLVLSGDSTATYSTGHGIKFYILSQE